MENIFCMGFHGNVAICASAQSGMISMVERGTRKKKDKCEVKRTEEGESNHSPTLRVAAIR